MSNSTTYSLEQLSLYGDPTLKTDLVFYLYMIITTILYSFYLPLYEKRVRVADQDKTTPRSLEFKLIHHFHKIYLRIYLLIYLVVFIFIVMYFIRNPIFIEIGNLICYCVFFLDGFLWQTYHSVVIFYSFMRKFIAYKLMIYTAYLFSLFIVVSTTYLRSIGYSKRVEYIVVTYFITQTTLLLFSGIFLAFRNQNQKSRSSENHMVAQIIVLAAQKCVCYILSDT